MLAPDRSGPALQAGSDTRTARPGPARGLVSSTRTTGVSAPASGTMGVMNRRSGTIVALVCALAALAGSSSVSAANGFVPTHKLHVDLTEWAVVPSQGLVSAGRLRLTVANYGVLRHELAIIPTQWWGETLDVHDGRAVGDSLARPIVVPRPEARTTAGAAGRLLRPGRQQPRPLHPRRRSFDPRRLSRAAGTVSPQRRAPMGRCTRGLLTASRCTRCGPPRRPGRALFSSGRAARPPGRGPLAQLRLQLAFGPMPVLLRARVARQGKLEGSPRDHPLADLPAERRQRAGRTA